MNDDDHDENNGVADAIALLGTIALDGRE